MSKSLPTRAAVFNGGTDDMTSFPDEKSYLLSLDDSTNLRLRKNKDSSYSVEVLPDGTSSPAHQGPSQKDPHRRSVTSPTPSPYRRYSDDEVSIQSSVTSPFYEKIPPLQKEREPLMNSIPNGVDTNPKVVHDDSLLKSQNMRRNPKLPGNSSQIQIPGENGRTNSLLVPSNTPKWSEITDTIPSVVIQGHSNGTTVGKEDSPKQQMNGISTSSIPKENEKLLHFSVSKGETGAVQKFVISQLEPGQQALLFTDDNENVHIKLVNNEKRSRLGSWLVWLLKWIFLVRLYEIIVGKNTADAVTLSRLNGQNGEEKSELTKALKQLRGIKSKPSPWLKIKKVLVLVLSFILPFRIYNVLFGGQRDLQGTEEQPLQYTDKLKILNYRVMTIVERPVMKTFGVLGKLFDIAKSLLPKFVKLWYYLTNLFSDQVTTSEGKAGSKGTMVLATVQGDVHDIGKNIVGVVMESNNFKVIDVGVSTPASKIIQTVIEEKADLVGLSGLVAPSLDHMVHVAKEMEKAGLNIPILIGGAATSKTHTARKIAPHYSHPVVYVPTAYKSVEVATRLLDPEEKKLFLKELDDEYSKIRAEHNDVTKITKYVGIEHAGAHKLKIDWFVDRPVGQEARKLYDDANTMLTRIINNKQLKAHGVVAFYPANSVGDDIEVYGESGDVIAVLHGLRQQTDKGKSSEPYLCISDFIAPKGTGTRDHIGLFAVTAGYGVDEMCQQYDSGPGKERDNYSIIMVKALADRLAEAFAEELHERVRKDLWGYSATEELGTEELHKVSYQGIRPAPGYPSQPDHSEKEIMWTLLQADRVGITLTDTMTMNPPASVSGLYLSHPKSYYFATGKINRDQIQDYAMRKQMSVSDVERWLSSVLAYDV